MTDQHSLPTGTWPEHAIRNNGPDYLVLERLKLRELAEGWPCYRDSCEWENFESIFHKDAHVYTTWSGRTPFADFIRSSKAGMDSGVFIMHRCHGTTTDITPDGTRAITKMKACITQRFVVQGDIEIDVEADCRFCFFFEKEDGKWGARLVRHWYEKDRIVPVVPGRLPDVDLVKLGAYPEGYKCLAYFQELTMGATVARDMPGHRRHAGTPAGHKHDLLYRMGYDWLSGKNLGDLDV